MFDFEIFLFDKSRISFDVAVGGNETSLNILMLGLNGDDI